MRHICAAICLSISASWVSAQGQEGRLPIAATTVLGRENELGVLMDGAVGPDGSFTVIDMSSKAIHRFAADGRHQWKTGRSGAGPGEFQTPDRLAVMSDGSVVIRDLARKGLTRLNSDGSYRDVIVLSLDFRQIDNFVALPGGGLAVAGIAAATSVARYGVHVFDSSFAHVRSFGPLPPVTVAAVVDLWGAGGLSLSADGDLLYTRRFPYEIYRYAPSGTLKQVIRSTLPLQGTPDESFTIQQTGSTVLTTATRKVTRLRKTVQFPDGRLLSGRMTGSDRTFDLLGPDGAAVAVLTSGPPGWEWVVAYDAQRNNLWVVGQENDAPVILKVSLVKTR